MIRPEQADSEPQPPPKTSPMHPVTMLLLAIVGLWAFWLLFVHVIAPLLPHRVIVNPEQHRGVGEALTGLKLSPLTGDSTKVSDSELRNRVTLLNFWGTWCPPCREELPHIAALQKRFAGRADFQLLAVSCPSGGQQDDVQSLREETAAMLKRMNLDLPTYSDADAATLAAVDAVIGFDGFPTTLLLDRKGIVRAVWVGYRPGVETEIERYVVGVLGEEK